MRQERLMQGTHAVVRQRNCSPATMAQQTARQTWKLEWTAPQQLWHTGKNKIRWCACYFFQVLQLYIEPQQPSLTLLQLLCFYLDSRIKSALNVTDNMARMHMFTQGMQSAGDWRGFRQKDMTKGCIIAKQMHATKDILNDRD